MLVFVGDIHGEFVELIEKLAGTGIEKSSLIQVGDFGLGFKSQKTEGAELENINTMLAASENTLYVIRGNHDNPNYFNHASNYSNIQFLSDYSLLTIEGLTILLVGGAIFLSSQSLRLGTAPFGQFIHLLLSSQHMLILSSSPARVPEAGDSAEN